MKESLIIAWISLAFSLIALGWNIIRAISLDRVKMKVRMFAGGLIPDDQGRVRMVRGGSTIKIRGIEQTIPVDKIFFQITNIGRRDIEVDQIVAEYNDKGSWVLPINDKRYLRPYESTSANTGNIELKEILKKKKIKSIFVTDTKGKKWTFSQEDIEGAFKLLS